MMLDAAQHGSGFPLVEIGAVVDAVRTTNPAVTTPDDEFIYVDLSAVDQDTKAITAPHRVLGSDAPSRARQVLKRGDVLVSTVRPNLNGVAIVSPDIDGAIGSTGFCVLRPAEGRLDSRYLYHWVRTPAFVEDMVRQATGASYPAVTDGTVRRSRIPAPPLGEQRCIAAILDEADALRAKRRAALAQLDELAQAIFVEMFGDPLGNAKGYKIARMGDVCDVRDGTHASPQYVSNGGFPLVTSKNLTKGYIDLTNVNHISQQDFQEINRRSKVDLGDIVLPMIGTIGSPVIVDREPAFAIKNVALIKRTKISPPFAFVHFLLAGQYFQQFVMENFRGGTQKFVSLGDLRAFPIIMPPQAEIETFATRIDLVNKIKLPQKANVASLDSLFASLQHRAFQGEL